MDYLGSRWKMALFYFKSKVKPKMGGKKTLRNAENKRNSLPWGRAQLVILYKSSVLKSYTHR